MSKGEDYIEKIYPYAEEDKREFVYIIMQDLDDRSFDFSHYTIVVTTKRELEHTYKWIDKVFGTWNLNCFTVDDFEKAIVETCHKFNGERRPPKIIVWHKRMRTNETN